MKPHLCGLAAGADDHILICHLDIAAARRRLRLLLRLLGRLLGGRLLAGIALGALRAACRGRRPRNGHATVGRGYSRWAGGLGARSGGGGAVGRCSALSLLCIQGRCWARRAWRTLLPRQAACHGSLPCSPAGPSLTCHDCVERASSTNLNVGSCRRWKGAQPVCWDLMALKHDRGPGSPLTLLLGLGCHHKVGIGSSGLSDATSCENWGRWGQAPIRFACAAAENERLPHPSGDGLQAAVMGSPGGDSCG